MPFDNRQRDAMDVVRRLVKADSSKVKLSQHARDQMIDRNIVARDIYRALEFGDPVGPLELGKTRGEVKLIVTFKPRGMRELGIVTIVVTATEKVFVKTVMWKDER